MRIHLQELHPARHFQAYMNFFFWPDLNEFLSKSFVPNLYMALHQYRGIIYSWHNWPTNCYIFSYHKLKCLLTASTTVFVLRKPSTYPFSRPTKNTIVSAILKKFGSNLQNGLKWALPIKLNPQQPVTSFNLVQRHQSWSRSSLVAVALEIVQFPCVHTNCSVPDHFASEITKWLNLYWVTVVWKYLMPLFVFETCHIEQEWKKIYHSLLGQFVAISKEQCVKMKIKWGISFTYISLGTWMIYRIYPLFQIYFRYIEKITKVSHCSIIHFRMSSIIHKWRDRYICAKDKYWGHP